MDFNTKLSQIWHLEEQGHKIILITDMQSFIIGITMDWSRLDEFLSIQQGS